MLGERDVFVIDIDPEVQRNLTEIVIRGPLSHKSER